MKHILIDVGCAECRGGGPISETNPPLVDARIFNHLSMEEIKTKIEKFKWVGPNQAWEKHPQGGEIAHFGQGAIWILPVEEK